MSVERQTARAIPRAHVNRNSKLKKNEPLENIKTCRNRRIAHFAG
ncbi:hypothetical protein HMPREF0645_2359 [Hallella bergensis DSM 17361]|uniref:Uncharacterized protein n=1 Tax=Hallella bergensis DSM 17361 TaxID=585502 RepID=D1PZH4_9BACT|nr:hypothetical protein HMPREF0645_2359 [Hallella bergensis DSM 17361]